LLTGFLLKRVILGAKKYHLGDLEGTFWVPWVNILVIKGSTRTPNRHLEVQVSICLSILVKLLESPGIHLGHMFVICFVTLSAQMGGSFQVHVFDDPGMEMMPACSVCMCYKHNKNNCVREILLFQLIH